MTQKEKKPRPVSRKVAQIVARLAEGRLVEQLVCNVTHHRCIDGDLEDLVQIVYIALLEMEAARLEQLVSSGEINYFLVRVIKNQYYTNHSPFHDSICAFRLRSSEISPQFADTRVNREDWDNLSRPR